MMRIVLKIGSMFAAAGLALTLAAALALESQREALPAAGAADPQIGRSFDIPYRLTETNHFLVRVRLNGKGPFNFLVDSGAPALYVATETAKKIGLKPDPDKFWTPIDRLDLEGGAHLEGIKARVEDPFQLVGMNALGLPGASIDGILGFTILARFRLEIDLTQDRMKWTRLAHDPRDPPAPKRAPGEKPAAPLGVQAMSTLGSFAKGLAFFLGKQPEEEQRPRGFLGLEWVERVESGRSEVEISRVLSDSPAAAGGLQSGDRILKINRRAVEGIKGAREALAAAQAGDSVAVVVRRRSGTDNHELKLTLTVGEGL
jgi:PDZ domain/Aspartyl protease